ncbi:MAG TPA: beta-L-arabinofuranosidase domain-containing protein [Fimbriimonadaceae bacterium]|nr:beta-L-arabinofuranosidase domain-containing protein [Fimbriimonadaceae bacterium]
MKLNRAMIVPAILVFGVADAQIDALATSMASKVKVQPVVSLKVRPFALDRVRLLDGPFKKAQDADHAYLLTLDPFRLLHGFYQNAGLPTKGDAYGGWEQMDIAGHSLGHYLTACSEMYAATGDQKLKDKVTTIVDELKRCQDVSKDGMVAGFPEAQRVWSEISRGEIKSQPFNLNGIWVPWYNEHKLLAGLESAYLYCDSADALLISRRLGDWAINVTKNLTHDQWQAMLGTEHGGMNEVLANLYAFTGEKKFLDLAMKFHDERVLDPLEKGERKLQGLHGNTQFPKIIGCAREYELSGQKKFDNIAENFWHQVVDDHTYVSGGNTMGEYFGPPGQLAARIGSNTTESCNTYNMLKLTQHLYCLHPTVELGDYYERALWNHILASVNPDDYGVTYFLPLGMGVQKRFSTPTNDFTCCHDTGMENHAKYGSCIYYEDGDTLYIDQFISSELDWKEKGVKVTMDATRLMAGELRIDVAGKPSVFTIKVRIPEWMNQAQYDPAALGMPAGAGAFVAKNGEYFEAREKWGTGLYVALLAHPRIHEEAMPDDASRVALFYGPALLAGVWPQADIDSGLNPAIVGKSEDPGAWLSRLDGFDTFNSKGGLKPFNMRFEPFYMVHGEKYSVFFDEMSADAWSAKVAAYAAEQARQKELDARTVEFVDVGSRRAVQNNDLKSEKSYTGVLNEKRWRDARDGGWFEFDIKVDSDGPNTLMLTYWGSDGGGREFDILVDGKAIAWQKLDNNKPGSFFDVAYDVPTELTKGKEKVTVRVQARPQARAGGVFGARMVRPKA